jgi:hypothetical protein
MKKLTLLFLFFCSLGVYADTFSLIHTIKQKEAVIYSDGSSENEHLLALIDTTDGRYAAYYVVETMFKNTVEALYYGYSKFEGHYLIFEGGLGTTTHNLFKSNQYDTHLSLTVFDVDENEGTITVRYDDDEDFPEKHRKLITFKRTNKFSGKDILLLR